MNNVKLPEITSKWVGVPYTSYGRSRHGGIDCFRLMVEVLRYYGYEIPEDTEIDGYNKDNYLEVYHNDRQKGVELWVKFISKFCEEKEKKDLAVGDIVLACNDENPEGFFTIFTGNHKIMTAFPNTGVKIVPIRNLKILRVFKGYQ